MPLKYNLQDLYLFSILADNGSFTQTAELLGMPKSRVSRRLAMLEAGLDARLIQRTTRAFALTSAGEEVFRKASAIAQHAREIEAIARSLVDRAGGTIRIGLPVSVEQLVFPYIVSHFSRNHPDVTFDLATVCDPRSMIPANIDLMLIRHGEGVIQETFIRTRLCEISWVVCIAPDAADRTSSAQGLGRGANFYLYRGLCDQIEPILEHSEPLRAILASAPVIRMNDVLGIHKLVRQGLGAGLLPRFLVRDELESGELVTVDPGFPAIPDPIYAIYPSRERLPHTIRLVIDCLRRELPAQFGA